MQKPNITAAGFFNMLIRSTLAKVALSFIAILALLFVLLGGQPAGALAQDEPTATETLAAFDTETPTATAVEPTATEEPTLAADTATEELTATATLAESETPTVDLSLTVTETPTETPTETATVVSCEGLGVDEVCDAVTDGGALRVIVELDMNYTPPSQLSDSAENAQEAAIESNQNALETQMEAVEAANPEAVVEQSVEMETMPYVAYTVDEAGLAALASSSLVEAVYESRENFASLDGSIPLIQADAVWNAGFTGYRGDGQTVAIIDTGILSTHEMFAGKQVTEWCFSYQGTYDEAGTVNDITWEHLCGPSAVDMGGFNAGTYSSSGPGAAGYCTNNPTCYHGTHVAGIAAGNDSNPTGGTHLGVAPDADIIAINVFTRTIRNDGTCPAPSGCLGANDIEILLGLDKVLALQGSVEHPDIASVNMSLGGGLYSAACNSANPAMKIAIDNLRAAGILTVAAAGNNGNTTNISYPACISTAVSVGATTGAGNPDGIASYSNRAGIMTVYGPGSGINSATNTGDTVYVDANGTSMASPHVAGVVALLQDWSGGDEPVANIINALKAGDPVTGSTIKRINALKALQFLTPNGAAPVLTQPANNGGTNNMEFNWNNVSGIELFTYHIEIDSSTTFNSNSGFPDIQDTESTQPFTPSLWAEPEGVYYWRVRAENIAGEFGPWSPTFKFTYDITPPADPNVTFPTEGSTITTVIPKFTWSAVPGAVGYRIVVDNGITAGLIDTVLGNVTSYQMTTAVPLWPGTTIVTVHTVDIGSNQSPGGAVRNFTVDPRLSPAPNSATTDDTPTLSWVAIAGATQIRVELDEAGDDYSAPLLDVLLPGNATSTGAPDLPQGEYQWRIRYQYGGSTWTDPSSSSEFIVTAALMTAPILTGPADNGLGIDPNVDFTWNAVAGASDYQYQLDTVNTFTSPDLDNIWNGLALPLLAGPQPDGVYFWRIRALDSFGTVGPWSAVRKFTLDTTPPTAPPLVSPTYGATVNSLPTFTWTKPANVTQTRLLLDIACGSLFGGAIVETPWGTATSFKPTLAQFPYEAGCWTVEGRDAAGNIAADMAGSPFTIDPPAPLAPGLIAPSTNTATADDTPEFEWSSVAYGNTYQFQLDTTNTFADPLIVDYTALVSSYEIGVTSDLGPPVPPATLDNGVTYYWRVRAWNSASETGAWSAVRMLTIDTTPPAGPAGLTAPANASSQVGNPTFTWTKPADATQTRLLVIQQGGDFNTPDFFTSWGTILTIKPTAAQLNLPAGTTIEWMVESRDAAGNEGPDSVIRTNTIKSPMPAVPVLVSPLTGAMTNDDEVNFDWNASANAATYTVQLATNATFTLGVSEQTGVSATDFEWSTLAQGTYYWRVKAVNPNSSPTDGAFSAGRSFTIDTVNQPAPVLNMPATGANVVYGVPTFMWGASAGAKEYQLVIDNEGDNFASPAFVSPWVTTTSYKPTVAQFSQAGAFEWNVRARDAAGNLTDEFAAAANDVIFLKPTPLAPVLVSPANALAAATLPAQLDWNASANSDSYWYQIATNSTFTSIVHQGTTGSDTFVNSGEFSPFISVSGTYYWRVRGDNANPQSGPYSAVRTFVYDITPPNAPALMMPADASTQIQNPSFTWAASPTATQYMIEIGSFQSGWITTTSFKPSAAQLGNGTFAWRVFARDAYGNQSSPSPDRTVTIKLPTPSVPVLVAPAASAMINDPEPVFSWNAAANAVDYSLQISSMANFSGGAVNETYPNVPTTSHDITGSLTLPAGTYYWRVRANNGDSITTSSAYSAARMFTVDTVAPADPVLSAPAAGSINVGYPTFTWMAVTGATQYKWQLDYDGANYSAPICQSGWISALTFKPTQLQCNMASASLEWRVLARDAALNVSPGVDTDVVHRRNISSSVPVPNVVPVLTGPANNSFINDSTPLFTWTSVPYGDSYEIWVDGQSNFALPRNIDYQGGLGSMNLSYQVGVTEGAPATLPDGKYYWWVWGYNSNNQHSAAWSTLYSFTIDTLAPAAPTLTGPASLSVARNTWPTFMWSAVSGASQYRIEVDQVGDGFGSLQYDSGWITGVSHKPAGAPPYGAYEWRMLTRDAAGNVSVAYSATRTFFEVTEALPVAPVLVSPASNLMTTDNTPTFYWNAVAGGDTYEIQIDNDSNFSSPVITATGISGLNHTTSWIPNGTFYWRVRAYNSTADGLAESGAWSASRIIKIVP